MNNDFPKFKAKVWRVSIYFACNSLPLGGFQMSNLIYQSQQTVGTKKTQAYTRTPITELFFKGGQTHQGFDIVGVAQKNNSLKNEHHPREF